jgi:elongation factor Ts
MAISIESIKELRERTQAGMADCKSALTEAEGDMDKAVEIILKKGQAKSAKRAGRVASEGEVAAEVFGGGREAVVVEVNIETDFSARNEKFKNFVQRVVAATKAAPEGAALEELSFEGKKLVDDANEITAIIGEKITLRRSKKLAVAAGKSGFCSSYIHMGGKIGVLLALETSSDDVAAHAAVKTFAEETAMQVAAMEPLALDSSALDPALISKQREIFEAQLRDEAKPKPEAMWPKIIDGKVAKWFQEVTLVDQESAQHKKAIKELMAEAGKAAGGEVNIVAYARFALGEGIEKKTEDLREGVAELLQ